MSCNLLLVFFFLLSLLKIQLKSPQMLSCMVRPQHPFTSVGLCSSISQSSLPCLSKGANYFTTVKSGNRISTSRGAGPPPTPSPVSSSEGFGLPTTGSLASQLSLLVASNVANTNGRRQKCIYFYIQIS